jgi:flavodoxin
MPRIGLFYASSAADPADVIKGLTGLAPLGEIDLFDIASAPANTISAYRHMIIGLPLRDGGEAPNAWKAYLQQIGRTDLSERIVAFYGLGAQEGYGETFLEAMTALYDLVAQKGGIIVGSWPIDASDPGAPARNEESGGLKRWVQQIAPYFLQ